MSARSPEKNINRVENRIKGNEKVFKSANKILARSREISLRYYESYLKNSNRIV